MRDMIDRILIASSFGLAAGVMARAAGGTTTHYYMIVALVASGLMVLTGRHR